MPASTNDLIRDYGAAWNADEPERTKLLEAVWADDGVYCDPIGRAEGRQALIEHIGALQARLPGHRIELVSGVDEHDRQFRFLWELRGPQGETVHQGTDFGTLGDDGRIQTITGFFGQPPLE